MAFPPRIRIRTPAIVASGCPAVTSPWTPGASGRFVGRCSAKRDRMGGFLAGSRSRREKSGRRQDRRQGKEPVDHELPPQESSNAFRMPAIAASRRPTVNRRIPSATTPTARSRIAPATTSSSVLPSSA